LRLLLDANVLIWFLFEPEALTPRVRRLINEESNELFVSRATLWEMSARAARGRLDMPGGSIQYVVDRMAELRIVEVPIQLSDILGTEKLDHHHHDPFDRILVAQALDRGLTILTADNEIPLYPVPVIWT